MHKNNQFTAHIQWQKKKYLSNVRFRNMFLPIYQMSHDKGYSIELEHHNTFSSLSIFKGMGFLLLGNSPLTTATQSNIFISAFSKWCFSYHWLDIQLIKSFKFPFYLKLMVSLINCNFANLFVGTSNLKLKRTQLLT